MLHLERSHAINYLGLSTDPTCTMADKGAPANIANKQGAFKDRQKPTEIRYANITAGKGTWS